MKPVHFDSPKTLMILCLYGIAIKAPKKISTFVSLLKTLSRLQALQLIGITTRFTPNSAKHGFKILGAVNVLVGYPGWAIIFVSPNIE